MPFALIIVLQGHDRALVQRKVVEVVAVRHSIAGVEQQCEQRYHHAPIVMVNPPRFNAGAIQRQNVFSDGKRRVIIQKARRLQLIHEHAIAVQYLQRREHKKHDQPAFFESVVLRLEFESIAFVPNAYRHLAHDKRHEQRAGFTFRFAEIVHHLFGRRQSVSQSQHLLQRIVVCIRQSVLFFQFSQRALQVFECACTTSVFAEYRVHATKLRIDLADSAHKVLIDCLSLFYKVIHELLKLGQLFL
mmetsp:Transcript_55572/g.92400  ORF Transcript_55572/g.92400 Transcript_55572/m.92400 type:complete len:245 (+) Transcript_55572:408-1142(+)